MFKLPLGGVRQKKGLSCTATMEDFSEASKAPQSTSPKSFGDGGGSSGGRASPHSPHTGSLCHGSSGRIPSLVDARRSQAFQNLEDPSKQRSMSVVTNPKYDVIERIEREKRNSSGFMRSNSLQTSTGYSTANRPAIPTGNMLTESLMAAAAERKRKKSVAASIRNIVKAEERKFDLPFYTMAVVLVVVIGLLIVMTVLWVNAVKVCQYTRWITQINGTHTNQTRLPVVDDKSWMDGCAQKKRKENPLFAMLYRE